MGGVVETVIWHEVKSSAISELRPTLEHNNSHIARVDWLKEISLLLLVCIRQRFCEVKPRSSVSVHNTITSQPVLYMFELSVLLKSSYTMGGAFDTPTQSTTQ